jgi:hypothetical protein
MEKLIKYESHIEIDANNSDFFAIHIWHFSNLFPSFEFSCNEIYLTSRSTFKEIVDAVKPKSSNSFTLSILDHNYNYIHQVIELLDFSLMELGVQLLFVPVD